MLVGATAGSTGSGLKMLRLVMLYKAVRWSLAALIRPPTRGVLRLTFDSEALARDKAAARVRAVTTLTIGWFAVSAFAVVLFVHCVPDDVPLQSVVFAVTSVQSNVGLSIGLSGPDLGAVGKRVTMAVMCAGRLKIVSVLALVALARRVRAPGASG